MAITVITIKNTLPYFYPYSVLAIDSSTDEKIILGHYKNKQDADLAREYFDLSRLVGIEYFRRIKKIDNNISDPIRQLEKRIKNPDTDKHRIIKKENKRKIILD